MSTLCKCPARKWLLGVFVVAAVLFGLAMLEGIAKMIGRLAMPHHYTRLPFDLHIAISESS